MAHFEPISGMNASKCDHSVFSAAKPELVYPSVNKPRRRFLSVSGIKCLLLHAELSALVVDKLLNPIYVRLGKL